MKIEEHNMQGVTVIKPGGPVVKTDADQLNGSLSVAIGDNPGRVVLDISGVAYVDSHALEVMMDRTESDPNLKLAGCNETIREVLELTDLSKHFEYFEDVDGAVRSLQ